MQSFAIGRAKCIDEELKAREVDVTNLGSMTYGRSQGCHSQTTRTLPRRTFSPIPGLIQDDFGGRVRIVQFMNCQTQARAIDGGEPFEPPVVRVLYVDRV